MVHLNMTNSVNLHVSDCIRTSLSEEDRIIVSKIISVFIN